MAVAGSVTKSIERCFDGYEVHWNWTADAAGAVTENSKITANGYLVGIVYNPGTAANAYDVTCLDSGSIDVMRGLGANQSNAAGLTYDTKYRSNIKDVDGGYFFFVNEQLTPTIANGGNLGTGSITFKFSRNQP